jgi:hypothetical protein
MNTCVWCGDPFVPNHRGRKRIYCKQSCRERAYEARVYVEVADVLLALAHRGAQ